MPYWEVRSFFSIAKELKEIDEQGIGIEPDSRNKVIQAVQEANKPIREYIRWLTYEVITAFGMLLVIGFASKMNFLGVIYL